MSLSNKPHLLILVAVFGVLLINGCTPTVTKSVVTTAYEEDISIHRNKYPEPNYSFDSVEEDTPVVEKEVMKPTDHIKSELDSVLTRIEKSREDINYMNGLTIQVYSGNNREMANDIKKKVYSISDDFTPQVSYDQPNYKVSVGKYFSRLEANKDFNVLKKEFTQALLVPKRIPIQSND